MFKRKYMQRFDRLGGVFVVSLDDLDPATGIAVVGGISTTGVVHDSFRAAR